MKWSETKDEVVNFSPFGKVKFELLVHQGEIEKVLNPMKTIKPRIVTVVKRSFAERITEALHDYYLAELDPLELQDYSEKFFH